MIDIHTHILPGIDDGCKHTADSIQLLQEEARQGVTEVVLTPHFYSQSNSISKFLERRQRAWDRLRPSLTPDLPSLRLGAEVQYYEGICAAEDLELLRIEGSRILLLEMPFSRWSERMVADVLELNSRDDIQILLAHIERYLDKQPKRTAETLLEQGVLLQSNISWFSSWQGRRQAGAMLKNGQLHVFGTDCHNHTHRPPKWDSLPQKLRNELARVNIMFARSQLEPVNGPGDELDVLLELGHLLDE